MPGGVLDRIRRALAPSASEEGVLDDVDPRPLIYVGTYTEALGHIKGDRCAATASWGRPLALSSCRQHPSTCAPAAQWCTGRFFGAQHHPQYNNAGGAWQ